jgi:hypothetical protein
MNDEKEIAVRKFKEIVAKMFDRRAQHERDVVITPFGGSYGLQGYVITINGSPAHGTAVVDVSREVGFVFASPAEPVKRIAKRQIGDNPKAQKYQAWDACVELLQACGLPLHDGGNVPVAVTIPTQETKEAV